MKPKDIVWKIYYKDGGVVTYDGSRFANTFKQAVINAKTNINKNLLTIAHVRIYDNTRPDGQKIIYESIIPAYDYRIHGGKPVTPEMMKYQPTLIFDHTGSYILEYATQ